MTPHRTPGGRLLKAAILLIALALAAVGCGCREESTGPEWKLVWQDEFDGPAGQSPDPARWRHDIGSGWGNAQLEYDTARPENSSLDGNGNLAIIARKEAYVVSGVTYSYTSARINTNGFFAQAYGRFEARMRLPSGQGLWPAFWMLGADFAATGWPQCGEIDIMEYRGQEPNVVHGSLHGPGYSGGDAYTERYDKIGAGFDADFHVFSVEWNPARITWMVDGSVYQTLTPDNLSADERWVFDHPFFVILNVAVGGNYVGPPNSGTTFPQTMLVDYVRVYGVSP